jgi:hypothetical protein
MRQRVRGKPAAQRFISGRPFFLIYRIASARKERRAARRNPVKFAGEGDLFSLASDWKISYK